MEDTALLLQKEYFFTKIFQYVFPYHHQYQLSVPPVLAMTFKEHLFTLK